MQKSLKLTSGLVFSLLMITACTPSQNEPALHNQSSSSAATDSLPQEVSAILDADDGILISVERRDANGDQNEDLFVTKASGYPSNYHFVFLWNPEQQRYVDVTPHDKMIHPNNDLRFNYQQNAFCSEYHGLAIPGVKESGKISSIELYTFNGFQKISKKSVSSDEVKNAEQEQPYCTKEKGWEIVSGI